GTPPNADAAAAAPADEPDAGGEDEAEVPSATPEPTSDAVERYIRGGTFTRADFDRLRPLNPDMSLDDLARELAMHSQGFGSGRLITSAPTAPAAASAGATPGEAVNLGQRPELIAEVNALLDATIAAADQAGAQGDPLVLDRADIAEQISLRLATDPDQVIAVIDERGSVIGVGSYVISRDIFDPSQNGILYAKALLRFGPPGSNVARTLLDAMFEAAPRDIMRLRSLNTSLDAFYESLGGRRLLNPGGGALNVFEWRRPPSPPDEDVGPRGPDSMRTPNDGGTGPVRGANAPAPVVTTLAQAEAVLADRYGVSLSRTPSNDMAYWPEHSEAEMLEIVNAAIPMLDLIEARAPGALRGLTLTNRSPDYVNDPSYDTIITGMANERTGEVMLAAPSALARYNLASDPVIVFENTVLHEFTHALVSKAPDQARDFRLNLEPVGQIRGLSSSNATSGAVTREEMIARLYPGLDPADAETLFNDQYLVRIEPGEHAALEESGRDVPPAAAYDGTLNVYRRSPLRANEVLARIVSLRAGQPGEGLPEFGALTFLRWPLAEDPSATLSFNAQAALDVPPDNLRQLFDVFLDEAARRDGPVSQEGSTAYMTTPTSGGYRDDLSWISDGTLTAPLRVLDSGLPTNPTDMGIMQYVQGESFDSGRVQPSGRSGIRPVDTSRLTLDETVFPVGQPVTGDFIRSLTSVNGMPVEQLQASMYPDPEMTDLVYRSVTGFLPEGADLLSNWAEMNDRVLEQGVTSQQISAVMQYFVDMHSSVGDQTIIGFNGQRYTVELKHRWANFQQSPFRDGSSGKRDYEIRNVDTGESLFFSDLTLRMAENWSYWQKDTPYSVDPVEIIDFFGIEGRASGAR
ncbi:MAG: hypothetical protein EA385_05600, partial [Salinarimonadaceae bacterium]